MTHAMNRRIARRPLVLGAAGAALAAPFSRIPSPASAAGGELRVGWQKGSATLIYVKTEGLLEEKVKPLGYTVSWFEFPAGPPLLEALNAGSLDVGTTGAPPPIFAQAAGTDLVYVLATAAAPTGQGILVPKDSAIQSPADLKGKKIGVTKGSSAHGLLVFALRAGGVDYADVEPVFLAPADAKAAFEGGSLDAWSIWDPYLAAEEKTTGARILVTDGDVGNKNRSFYEASRAFATEHVDALKAFAEVLTEAEGWVDTHPDEVAQAVAAETGLPFEITRAVEERAVYGIGPITPEIIAEQQQLADAFFELQLIPEKIDVSKAAFVLPA
ncbi:MAG: aliphatic sulfonate ABC transporter substrate-binding protein [Chloroflexota bacterium]